ncbi:MAG: hypothetical protein QXZ66_04875 [Thermoproteota archaeon]
MFHCQLIQAGEIQAIVGDASRNGIGGPQYCGLWSLTSKHRPFNAFGNSYAGLIPGELRGKSPILNVLDETTVVLYRRADASYPVDAYAMYQIKEPYYIDHVLKIRDGKNMLNTRVNVREVSWCSYINSPENPFLHFISNGKWCSYISPQHGVGANIAPSYVPDEELEIWPDEPHPPRPFHWHRANIRFDEPLYYGRLGNMILIFIFDTPRWLRFYCSPTGGGDSLLPGKYSPAWDFEWLIPAREYQVGREYQFRMRLVYKKYVDDEDAWNEYEKAVRELGFETV